MTRVERLLERFQISVAECVRAAVRGEDISEAADQAGTISRTLRGEARRQDNGHAYAASKRGMAIVVAAITAVAFRPAHTTTTSGTTVETK